MVKLCCILCESKIAKSNSEGLRILLENPMTVLSTIEEPNCEGMLLLKECLKISEYRKLIKCAQRHLNENKDPYAPIVHDRYGQTKQLTFTGQSHFKVLNGKVPFGNILEIIGKKVDKKHIQGFLQACADESVKVFNGIGKSNIDMTISMDSAIYFNLKRKSYKMIRASEEGTKSKSYDLLPQLSDSEYDKRTLMHHVGSVLANETGYRTIVIENIVKVGSEEERKQLPNPYEWIKLIQSHTTLYDKWIILGLIIPNKNLYAGCDGKTIQQMVNNGKDRDNVKVINFVDAAAANVEDLS